MRKAVAFPGHVGATRAEGCPATAEKMGRSLGVAAACRSHPQAQPRQPGAPTGRLQGPDQGKGGTQPPGGGLGFHAPFSSLLLGRFKGLISPKSLGDCGGC